MDKARRGRAVTFEQETMKKTRQTTLLIGALCALLTVGFLIHFYHHRRISEQQRIEHARDEIRRITYVIGVYVGYHREFPSEQAGLGVLWTDAVTAPFCIRNPTDPWGTPLSYRIDNGFPRILSAGPDKKFGTSDDIK